MKKIASILAVGALAFAGSYGLAQQQHDHSQMQMGQSSGAPSAAAASVPLGEENAIFCPTMKTGQLCSHGTAQVLGLKGPDADAWMEIARKYNKAVDAATMQLFKDAEG